MGINKVDRSTEWSKRSSCRGESIKIYRKIYVLIAELKWIDVAQNGRSWWRLIYDWGCAQIVI